MWSAELAQYVSESCSTVNCKQCTESDECLLCYPDYFLSDQLECRISNMICEKGFFYKEGTCVRCSKPCLDCFNEVICYECPPEFALANYACAKKKSVALSDGHSAADVCRSRFCIEHGARVLQQCENRGTECALEVKRVSRR